MTFTMPTPKERDQSEVDYRQLFAQATTARERSKVIENERRTARNTKTGTASYEVVNGVPLPHSFGAMCPTGLQPALHSLSNYIRSGFVFGEGNNAKDYAQKHYSRVYEDWKTRFGMQLEW